MLGQGGPRRRRQVILLSLVTAAAVVVGVAVLLLFRAGDAGGTQPFDRQHVILGIPVRIGDTLEETVPVSISSRVTVVTESAGVLGATKHGVTLRHAGFFGGILTGSGATFPSRSSICLRYHTWQMQLYEGCTHVDASFCCYRLINRIYRRLNPHAPPSTWRTFLPLSIRGMRVDRRTQAGIAFDFALRAKGIYTLGPVVVSGYIAQMGASRGPSFTQALPQILVACVSVPDKACTSTVHRTEALWNDRWSH